MTVLLGATGLDVSIRGRTLLSALSFELSAGELVAVVGPSGCGKTTLLRTLALLIDPAAGELSLEGETPDAVGITQYRRRVAYVQQRPVVLNTSVRDNLCFAFAFRAAQGEYDEHAACEWFERLGLDREVLDQEARTVSEGQMQRICLVRTLLTRPQVLLLDEPTSALDQANVEALEALLAEQIERDCAALIVTHDPRQIARLGARQLDLEEYGA